MVGGCTYMPFSLNKTATDKVPDECIKFTRNTQLNTIIQTSETDSLRIIWKSYLTKLSPETPLPDNNYDIISAWLDVADIHLLEKQSDRITVVMIGTQLGWRYDKTPLFNAIFKAYDPQKDSLLAATQRVRDVTWEHYIEQWPHKELYPLTPNSPTFAETTWDMCRDRCDILTAVTQKSPEGPNIHLDITNMDGHPWVTVFGTQLPCHKEEDHIIQVNGKDITAHVYCPRPDIIAADFPDKKARSYIIENIKNSNIITIKGLSNSKPAIIPNKGGKLALSDLGITPLH